MTVFSEGYASVLPQELVTEIGKIDGIKYVYGRMHICDEITSTKDVNRMELIFYEASQFDWAKDDYLSGDMEAVKNESVSGCNKNVSITHKNLYKSVIV